MFDGEWLDGKPHGYGKFSKDNYMIQGIFENGTLNGYGVITYSNGSIYEGEIRNNNANGYGKFVGSAGYKNLGYWKDGVESGRSITIYKSGDCYIGEHINGEKSGYGKYIWKEGQEYIGQWKNDQREGIGKYTWSGGDYEGEWKNGKKHGKGKECKYKVDEDFSVWPRCDYCIAHPNPAINIVTFASFIVEDNRSKLKETYEGEFVDGYRHGRGSCTYKLNILGGKELKLIGVWCMGKKTGRFIVYHNNEKFGVMDF